MIDYKLLLESLLKSAYYEGFGDRGVVNEQVTVELLEENYDNSGTKHLVEFFQNSNDEEKEFEIFHKNTRKVGKDA